VKKMVMRISRIHDFKGKINVIWCEDFLGRIKTGFHLAAEYEAQENDLVCKKIEDLLH
jgi:hypothetical protein